MKQLRMNSWAHVCGIAALCGSIACSSDDDGSSLNDDAKPVLEGYAALVYANYSDALTETAALKTAVDTFVATPTAANQTAAKNAWLAARDPYGQSEVFRFYDGPIDNPEDGPEGALNAWPMDEVYVDYVMGMATAGIINDTTGFPTLSKQIIAEQNEKDGEKNISTGYHAVEFLLWGQDLSATGPGARSFTDYVTTGGTNANQARRGTYLRAVSELLVDDLTVVKDAWAPNATNYRAEFVALSATEGLRRILQGMGSLAGAELSGERMTVAVDNRDQEDEHSCFSDNTHRDIRNNALAIQNAYLGRYEDGSVDGPGLDDLVRSRDAALDTKLKNELQASLDAIAEIPVPFDQALMSDAGRAKILAAVDALQTETETIVEVATLLGVTLNLE
jgi:putative iron-regulated protein